MSLQNREWLLKGCMKKALDLTGSAFIPYPSILFLSILLFTMLEDDIFIKLLKKREEIWENSDDHDIWETDEWIDPMMDQLLKLKQLSDIKIYDQEGNELYMTWSNLRN